MLDISWRKGAAGVGLLVGKRSHRCVYGAGVVVAGLAAAFHWRKVVLEKAVIVKDLGLVKEEVQRLHVLAANESVVYLRGYMDGQEAKPE